MAALFCSATFLFACTAAPASVHASGIPDLKEESVDRQPEQQPVAAPVAEGTPPDCNAANTYDADKGWFRSNSVNADPDCRSDYLMRRGKDDDAPLDNTDFFRQRDKKIDTIIDRQYRNLNSGGQSVGRVELSETRRDDFNMRAHIDSPESGE